MNQFMEEAAKKHLLAKYLDGLCSQDELRQVELLRKEPGIELLWDELLTERSAKEWNEEFRPDAELKSRTKKKMAELWATTYKEEKRGQSQNNIRKIKTYDFLRYAAVWSGIAILTSVAVWQIKKTSSNGDVIAFVDKVNLHGAPAKYVLPDSSEVFLGAGSRLHYPENFSGSTREIELQGEAFFQVVHNMKKPFIIHTGSINTQVLGTSFKVTAFNKQNVIVAVATGKVGVSEKTASHSQTLGLLTPGFKITWNGLTGKAIQGKVDVSSLQQWKNGDMIFDEQLLGNVADELQRRYDIQVIFKDKDAANNHVGGSFSSNEPIEKVMKMLSVVGEFSYENKDNKTFTIYKIK